jgi:hypothetical protein
VAYLTAPSQRLSRRNERSHESSHYCIRYPGRDSNSGRSEYEAGILTTLPTRYVTILQFIYSKHSANAWKQMGPTICRNLKITLYVTGHARCCSERKIPLMFKKIKIVKFLFVYLCNQLGFVQHTRIVVYRPGDKQTPRNKQRVQPLLCNRQINKRPFLSNGSVNMFPRKRTRKQ